MKITVIVVDCLRADSVGSRMQEFLDSGLEFTQAYAAGPTTIPSVPTYLTGLLPSEHGLVTANHKLLVPTITERVRKMGFHTIGYSANNLASLHKDIFDEWKDLHWMSNYVQIGEPTENDPLFPGQPWNGIERVKATQESYKDVWEDIAGRKGDVFAYVHLMDVHEPFRRIPSIGLVEFPHDYRTFRFLQWINKEADKGGDALTDEQWGKVWELYRAEIAYLDERLEFPGDIVIFMADHGQLIREGERGAWLGHLTKFFLENSLRVPFGIVGLGTAGVKCNRPFNLRFLPDVIMTALGKGDLPTGDDLYWEDFWHETATYAIKDVHNPIETLVMHSTGEIWYQGPQGNTTKGIEEVPARMVRKLAERRKEAEKRAKRFELRDESEAVVKRRLEGLGYI